MLRGMIAIAATAVSLMNGTIQVQNVTQVSPTSQPTTRIVFNTKTGYREV